MFYVFSCLPEATVLEADAQEVPMKLTGGVIHQVDILFQDGCNHETFVRIFDGSHQVWPSNPEEKLRGNATVISFREFYPLAPGDNFLNAKVWNSLTEEWAEVIIQIGILPKNVIQPLSFDELLAAAAGF